MTVSSQTWADSQDLPTGRSFIGYLLFWPKYVLDNSFPRRGVAVECKHAAINKMKAGKVGGSGPRRDRGVGRK